MSRSLIALRLFHTGKPAFLGGGGEDLSGVLDQNKISHKIAAAI